MTSLPPLGTAPATSFSKGLATGFRRPVVHVAKGLACAGTAERGANVLALAATRPMDFRKEAEGLAALVREEMRADPFEGDIFVLRVKRAARIKLLLWWATTHASKPSGCSMASSGPSFTTARSGSLSLNSEPCWRAWTGGASTEVTALPMPRRHRVGRRAQTLPIDQLELGLEGV